MENTRKVPLGEISLEEIIHFYYFNKDAKKKYGTHFQMILTLRIILRLWRFSSILHGTGDMRAIRAEVVAWCIFIFICTKISSLCWSSNSVMPTTVLRTWNFKDSETVSVWEYYFLYTPCPTRISFWQPKEYHAYRFKNTRTTKIMFEVGMQIFSERHASYYNPIILLQLYLN
jgi:hypothetical protein